MRERQSRAPRVILSFGLAALACVFSALSYAELASSIPVSGSAYTYTYATLGEIVAWIIGWDLILEYGVSVAAVAVGWGGNFNEFLENAFGVALPAAISAAPSEGGIFNLPAVIIVLVITWLLVIGVRESAQANFVMVIIKLVVLVFFIIAAATSINTDHFTPFAPAGFGGVLPPRRSSSLPISASTRYRPEARRPRTPARTSLWQSLDRSSLRRSFTFSPLSVRSDCCQPTSWVQVMHHWQRPWTRAPA